MESATRRLYLTACITAIVCKNIWMIRPNVVWDVWHFPYDYWAVAPLGGFGMAILSAPYRVLWVTQLSSIYLALYEKSQTVQTTFAFSSCTTVYDQSPADDPLSRMGRHEVILSWTNVMTKTCLMCQFTFSYTTFTNKYKEGTLRLPLLVKRDSDTGFSTFIMCSWIEPSLYNLQYDMLQYLPSVKVSLICTGSIRFRVVFETCVFILNLIEINSFL